MNIFLEETSALQQEYIKKHLHTTVKKKLQVFGLQTRFRFSQYDRWDMLDIGCRPLGGRSAVATLHFSSAPCIGELPPPARGGGAGGTCWPGAGPLPPLPWGLPSLCTVFPLSRIQIQKVDGGKRARHQLLYKVF